MLAASNYGSTRLSKSLWIMHDSEESKKKDELNRNFMLGFFQLRESQQNLLTRFGSRIRKYVVCNKLFAVLFLGFNGTAPIPYVQAAILNLSNPWLRSTIHAPQSTLS